MKVLVFELCWLFTYEINGKTAIGISSGGFVEETFTVRSSNRFKGGGYASGVGIRISEVVNRRESTGGVR